MKLKSLIHESIESGQTYDKISAKQASIELTGAQIKTTKFKLDKEFKIYCTDGTVICISCYRDKLEYWKY